MGDLVMLKISPMKGVRRFGKGKLASKYIGPFQIIDRIGVVSYHLELPDSLADVHNVFHVSMLRKHLQDEEQQRVVDLLKLQLQPDITTKETPVRILAKEDKLRNRVIPLVKVQWNRRDVEKTSWKREEDMRRDYPQLFKDKV